MQTQQSPLTDFSDVVNAIQSARSKQEIIKLVEVIDDRYLNRALLIVDASAILTQHARNH